MHSVLIIWILILCTGMGCPPPENIQPCSCEVLPTGSIITCSSLSSEQQLVKVVNSIKGISDIHSMNILFSHFHYLPHDVFIGVKFKELEIKATSLMALTDTDVAFEGLEDHLEILMMIDCIFMNEWTWSIFSKLKRLRRLDIIHGDMKNIGGEDFGIVTVNDINFSHNRISYIHQFAFSNFKDLFMLLLRANEIGELSRTMFPVPALEFKRLDLSYNRIQEVPDDLFTNMPQLELIDLAYNRILVLKENTFSSVWEQLDHFSVLGNELRCDCRLSWVMSKKHARFLQARCATPGELKGKNLVDLTPNDLWCY